MTDFRKKHLLVLAVLFLIGLIVVFSISDRRPRSLKAMNAAFGTEISSRADLVYKFEYPPSFQGDGVSYYVYRLDQTDMHRLQKALSTKKSYAIDSKIGVAARSDLGIANDRAKDAYSVEPLSRFRFYYIDRSPQIYDDVIPNYDALLVDAKDALVIYLVSDS
ncbi:MAG: hypothetical protein PUG99_04595 [Firmicutes bacterium]|nr:hypothetical protein [Bacillota bacterium]